MRAQCLSSWCVGGGTSVRVRCCDVGYPQVFRFDFPLCMPRSTGYAPCHRKITDLQWPMGLFWQCSDASQALRCPRCAAAVRATGQAVAVRRGSDKRPGARVLHSVDAKRPNVEQNQFPRPQRQVRGGGARGSGGMRVGTAGGPAQQRRTPWPPDARNDATDEDRASTTPRPSAGDPPVLALP